MSAVAVPRRSRQVERAAEAVALGRLRPPRLRMGVVERPRLAGRLDELTLAPLTVVAAPTGYGKTTLLASWAGAEPRQVAWASVGPYDLDADAFWALVAAALEHAEPRLRFGLRSDRRAEDRAVLTAAALEPLTRELVLVLDGYEQATRAGVDAAFSRFLDLAPEALHVVVSTRCLPELALPVRRARGAVAELSAADLALDAVETAAVLERTAEGDVADEDAAALAEHTEGWAAAVYLAALSARAAAQPSEALARFSGAAHDVAEYLRLELLDAQPDDALRAFLLETSVLERLSAQLCDTLLRRRDSESTLRALSRGGAFLVPLGGTGREYRYVRPVREFLRAELARSAPERVAGLHRGAAVACERAGLVDEAATHARAAAGDDEAGENEAAAVLARHALELVRDGHTDHLESLLGTRAGAAAAQRRPALRAALRRLARADSDVAALGAAAERVAALSGALPGGPVRALIRSTAQAAEAYAMLLTGRIADAYETGAAVHATAEPDAAAAVGRAAAVASLAASRLGLHAAASPLARASASALARRRIRSGTAAALAVLAEAAVVEEQGDRARAERLCADALLRTDEPAARALALLHLARLQPYSPAAARAVLEDASVELSRCRGAALLETFAAEVESELGSRERTHAARGELSAAEQRVLRLLATRLSQREIARELYVSPNTVKTHARVIYRKLGVDSRSAAVAAARELNLI
jgi:LuxR family maltose regulon positive regulatory protein